MLDADQACYHRPRIMTLLELQKFDEAVREARRARLPVALGVVATGQSGRGGWIK